MATFFQSITGNNNQFSTTGNVYSSEALPKLRSRSSTDLLEILKRLQQGKYQSRLSSSNKKIFNDSLERAKTKAREKKWQLLATSLLSCLEDLRDAGIEIKDIYSW